MSRPDPVSPRGGDGVPPEPFAYLSSPRRSLPGREPWVLLLTGAIAWGIGVVCLFLPRGAGGTSGLVAAAVFCLVVGTPPVVIGLLRARWARRYRAVHHHSPWSEPPR